MSITISIEGLEALRKALAECEAAVEENVNARTRAVSVKAKNLTPGDVIEWPYGFGRQPVNGMCKWPDRVDLSADSSVVPFASFDPEQRVRVYR